MAIEDKRFYEHHGVDFAGRRARACRRPARRARRAGRQHDHGAVRQERLPGANPTASRRKIREAVLAWELEDRWSKDQILTAYLNTVYYGAGAYGVEAASRPTSTSTSGRLTLPQCALLAALPRFPSGYSPVTDPEDASQRAAIWCSTRWPQQGYITRAPSGAAAKGQAGRVRAGPGRRARGPAAYFVDYVTAPARATATASRETFEGGLRVYTTLDMRMQRAAITGAQGSTLPPGPAGALVSIDPATGYIRAMVASTDFRTTTSSTWPGRRIASSARR